MTFFIFWLSIKYNLKQKDMIFDFILSVLLLIVGFAFSALILLFGVKFCKDGEKLPDDTTWKDILLQLIKGYPYWVWLFIFLAFQPAIVHILNTWVPSLLTNCEWVLKFSDFIGFITVILFFIIFYITDDNGKLKIFKKSEWIPQKNSFRIREELFNFNWLFYK